MLITSHYYSRDKFGIYYKLLKINGKQDFILNKAGLFEAAHISMMQKIKIIRHINSTFPNLYENYDIDQSKILEEELIKLGSEKIGTYRKILEEMRANVGTDKSFVGTITAPSEFGPVLELGYSQMIFGSKVMPFLREMCLIYLISNFEEFLKNVLSVVFTSKPEALKSTKQISVEEVINSGTMPELLEKIIEHEVNDILDEGIDKYEKFLEDRFGVPLSTDSDWTKFKEKFYRRNLLVHNNGIVNKKYISLSKYSGSEKQLTIDNDYLVESLDLSLKFSKIISEFLSKKFKS